MWEHMTDFNNITEIPEGCTPSTSSPHADSRDMALRLDGFILEGDDGGIVVRSNPYDNTGDWFGLCGNLQVLPSRVALFAPLFLSSSLSKKFLVPK
jgi:hypothetical protein